MMTKRKVKSPPIVEEPPLPEEPTLDTFTIALGAITQAAFDACLYALSPSADTYAMWRAYQRDGAILIRLEGPATEDTRPIVVPSYPDNQIREA